MKRYSILLCLSFLVVPVYVIARQSDGLPIRQDYWGDVNGYLEAQSAHALDMATQLLEMSPPQTGTSPLRLAALTLIDQVVHLPDAKSLSALRYFYHRRMKGLVDQLKRDTRPLDGAVVYKLYNHGYIVRTNKATYGLDIYRGPDVGGFALADSLMREIINECDLLLVSHWHPDHADAFVARTFLEQAKPVVSPDSVWHDQDFYDCVLHPGDNRFETMEIQLVDGRKINFVAFKGHQGSRTLNNCYLIKDDGLSFAHTGDQEYAQDFEWIDLVKKHHKVDLLFPNCWATDLQRLISGFDPAVIIPGHNNEINHSVDHREAYWQNEGRMGRYRHLAVELAWGEAYNFRKD